MGEGVADAAGEVAIDRIDVRGVPLRSLASCTSEEQRRVCMCCEKGLRFGWKLVLSVGKNRDIEVLDDIPRRHIAVLRAQLIVCGSIV